MRSRWPRIPQARGLASLKSDRNTCRDIELCLSRGDSEVGHLGGYTPRYRDLRPSEVAMRVSVHNDHARSAQGISSMFLTDDLYVKVRQVVSGKKVIFCYLKVSHLGFPHFVSQETEIVIYCAWVSIYFYRTLQQHTNSVCLLRRYLMWSLVNKCFGLSGFMWTLVDKGFSLSDFM
jgi:hypothetical protein